MSQAQQLSRCSVSTPARRNQYWLIAKRRRGRLEVLTAALPDGQKMLPVFSFEEEANLYLRHVTLGTWQLRRTGAGELVSVLCSLCSQIEHVALDPMPGVESGMINGLVSLGRERFVDVILRTNVPRRSPDTPALVGVSSARAQTEAAVS